MRLPTSIKLPRALHRFWAWLHGYFWAHCELCLRCFGGHEVLRESANLHYHHSAARLICPDPLCHEAAGMLNEQLGHNIAMSEELRKRLKRGVEAKKSLHRKRMAMMQQID